MSTILAATTLVDYFQESWELPTTCAYVIAALFHVALLGAFFGLPAGIFIWAERKMSGRIQDRLGPTRTGGRFGWLQTLADGAKLVQKEDLAPADADKMLFRVAPYFVIIASFAAYMVLPFSDGWVAVGSDIGLFLILAILSLEVVGVILAGYSSASKWALYGAIREAAQMVSYEIPMAMCALVPIIAAGSLNLVEIGRMQTGGFWNWFVFHDPFTFLAFFTYFTCATASCKRAPFDLAEAESELVAGFLTEYSGMRWSFFFLGEYASMYAVSAIAALLFLGGWDIGIPIIEATPLRESGLGNYVASIIGFVVLLSKASVLVLVQIWVRWTLPRLRIDQVMMTCLKYLLPISCFLFLGAIVWPLVISTWLPQTTLWPTPLGEKIQRPASARRLPIEAGKSAKVKIFSDGSEQSASTALVERND